MNTIIFTSYYSNPTKPFKNLISTSLVTPKWFVVDKEYDLLKPKYEIIKGIKDGEITTDQYIKSYVLNLLKQDKNIYEIVKELKGCVLYCYEKPNDFCHRHVVKDMFNIIGYPTIEIPNTKTVSIAVVGSRTFTNMDITKSILDQLYEMFPIRIVSGGARGADTLGEEYGKEKMLDTAIYLPDYNKYGKSAPFIRNKDIIDNADLAVSLWDGKSKGTKHAMDIAVKQGKQVLVYNEDKQSLYLYNEPKYIRKEDEN